VLAWLDLQLRGLSRREECIREHPNKPHRIAVALAEANEPIEWSSQLGVLLIRVWNLLPGWQRLFGRGLRVAAFSRCWPGQKAGDWMLHLDALCAQLDI